MSNAADSDLVKRLVGGLQPIAKAVEMGPWLGALTVSLKGVQELHVIDNFIWTKDHDKRVPSLHAPGECFKDSFAKLMAQRDLHPQLHESSFASYQWSQGKIDLCLIDSPKLPKALLECLNAVQDGLEKGSLILLKNGLSTQFLEMMLYAQALVGTQAFELYPEPHSDASNMLVLRVSGTSAQVAQALAQVAAEGLLPGEAAAADLENGPLSPYPAFQAAVLGHFAANGDWQAAYAFLDQTASHPELTRHWKHHQQSLATKVENPDELDWFSAVLRAHNLDGTQKAITTGFHKSLDATLSAFWLNNKGQSWRAASMHPAVLKTAFDYGYMKWASKISEFVKGKTVLDVGCGPGLHGLGYLTAGAQTYVGLDPIIKLDQDRVKNLSQKSIKVPFGWTPAELSHLIEPWTVQPDPIESLSEDELFDFAVMHNVTEHLQEIEMVFAEIAKRLKPDGVLLYNHHNFFSWNGHHLAPKTVSAIRANDPEQAEMIDWGHVDYDPDPKHYIARGLNRIRLDDILALTEKYFVIEQADEILSKPETGLGRLNDAIRERHPHLTDRDFETQNLLCLARRRMPSKAKAKSKSTAGKSQSQ